MRRRRIIVGLGVTVAVLATAAGAARGAEAGPGAPAKAAAKAKGASPDKSVYLSYREPGMPETAEPATVVGRVLGSLAVVVGLIFVTAVLLKRFLGGAKVATTSRKVSELVEVTPLGGKRFLYLIRVADRLLVVGGGGERLALLSEITDPAVLAQLAGRPQRSDFFDLLRRVRGGKGEDAPHKKKAAAG